jgi:hypothetical protein
VAKDVPAALRAGDAELRALAMLADRLGVTDASVARDLRAAQDLATAVGVVAATSSEAGILLADVLEQLGQRVYADILRKSTSRNKGIIE